MPTVQEAIETADRAVESTFNQRDADGISRLYTDESQLLPPGSDVVSGQGDIAAFWQQIYDMGIENAEIDTVESEEHAETAIEVGQFTLSAADDQTIDHGTFVVIWKNPDGEWKLSRDIWNSNIAEKKW